MRMKWLRPEAIASEKPRESPTTTASVIVRPSTSYIGLGLYPYDPYNH
jgi:hypothetical protein